MDISLILLVLKFFFAHLKDNHPKKAPAILELFSDFDVKTLSFLNLLFSTEYEVLFSSSNIIFF